MKTEDEGSKPSMPHARRAADVAEERAIRDVPEALDRLALNDPIVYAFVSSLRATGRRWDSNVALELVAAMAERIEVQHAQLVRLLSLMPMPPLVLPQE